MVSIASNEPNYFGSKLNHNYYFKTHYAHPYHNLLLNNGYHLSIYLSIFKYNMELTEREKL